MRRKLSDAALRIGICVMSVYWAGGGQAIGSDRLSSESVVCQSPCAANYSFEINPRHDSLKGPMRQPKSEAVTVQGESPYYRVSAFVKKAPKRGPTLWLEIYVENLTDSPLKNIRANFSDVSGTRILPVPSPFEKERLYDLSVDAFSDAVIEAPISLGEATVDGFARIFLAVPHAVYKDVSFRMEITAEPAQGAPSSTARMAISKDGAELWATNGDAGRVSVFDVSGGATGKRLASFVVGGRPLSVDFAGKSEEFVLVTLADTNEVVVFDRSKKDILQVLGEQDGLGRDLRSILVHPSGDKVFVGGYVTGSVDVLQLDDAALLSFSSRSASSVGPFRWVKQVEVGSRPIAMSMPRDGSELYVTHYMPRGPIRDNEAWISVLDTRGLAGEVRKSYETVLHDNFNDDNLDCVKKPFTNPFFQLRFGKTTDEDVALESVFSQAAGVFLNPNGSMAYVPGTAVSGGVQVWETGPNADKSVSGLVTFRPGELSIPIVIALDRRRGRLEPQVMDGYERQVDKGYSKCMAFERQFDFTRGDYRETEPDQLVSRVATFPTGVTGLSELGNIRNIAFTQGGRRALLLSFTSDEIAVQDAMTGHPTSINHFMLSGANPDSIVVSPDGLRAYVSYENSTYLSVIDLAAYSGSRLPSPSYVPYEYKHVKDIPFIVGVLGQREEEWLVRHVAEVDDQPRLREVGRLEVIGTDFMDAEMRRGKILFNSSNPNKYSVSANRGGACASCHPEGGNDGSVWATMEGERRTMSLRGGVAGRGWLHISATHQNIEEFVELVVPERLGGDLSKEDYHALARYIGFGIPRLQSPVVDEALAAEGKQVFEDNCTSCHAGPLYTSELADANDPFGGGLSGTPALFDLGTGTDNARVLLGTIFEKLFPEKEAALLRTIRGDRTLGDDDYAQQILDFTPRPYREKGYFKAPSLVNVWDNSVFFHTGEFSTLEEVVKYTVDELDLGLNADEQKAVVEYLKTL